MCAFVYSNIEGHKNAIKMEHIVIIIIVLYIQT